jgi:soluble lytic murein transglycosylase
VPCSQPTKEKILEYVNNAVSDPNVNRYGADAALVKAVISAESSGLQCVNGRLNVNAKGATGLMQLMPRTAADLNKNFQPPLEPALAQDNIKLGTAYLSYLLRLFNGDRNKAIASYNCGPGNIAKLASYGSDWMPHIDEVCKKETRPYVAKVNACMAACSLKECGIC